MFAGVLFGCHFLKEEDVTRHLGSAALSFPDQAGASAFFERVGRGAGFSGAFGRITGRIRNAGSCE